MSHPVRLNLQRFLGLACLILAGEMIFSLPFHVPRFFRPTVLEVLHLSNSDLGDVFAVYGVTAMLSYFPGGALADRYPSRWLIAGSLVATAMGGLYLAEYPSTRGLAVLYGYWGITTILLFWAALIRATREWGGEAAQGRAFGLLEGGRGLAAAGFASVAVVALNGFMVAGDSGAAERAAGLRAVIHSYSAVTALLGLVCGLLLASDKVTATSRDKHPRPEVLAVLHTPAVWLQALVVVSAYCGYKGLDYYALFARDRLGMSEVASAEFMANSAYLRPISAIAAGLVADRLGARATVLGTFAVAAGGYLFLAAAGSGPLSTLYANAILTVAAVFGLRGVYFALLNESRVPPQQTGVAVGVISVVGYLPDVFFAPLAGRLLDHGSKQKGFQDFFLLLAGIMIAGLLSALLLRRRFRPGAR